MNTLLAPAYSCHEGGQPVHAVHQVGALQAGLLEERRVEEGYSSGASLQ